MIGKNTWTSLLHFSLIGLHIDVREFYDHITMDILIIEAIWTCASVTTSTTLMPLSLKNCIPRRKQAFTRLVLFLSVLRLSIVVMHRISWMYIPWRCMNSIVHCVPGCPYTHHLKMRVCRIKYLELNDTCIPFSIIPYFTHLFKFFCIQFLNWLYYLPKTIISVFWNSLRVLSCFWIQNLSIVGTR